MEFYIYLNGEKRGPFPEAHVHLFLADGLVRPTDLAANGPDAELKPLGSVLRAPAATEVAAPAVEIVEPLEAARERAPVGPLPTAPAAFADLPQVPAETLGPYSRSTLSPNETAYLRTSLHWIVFVRYGMLGMALFFFAALPFAIALQALAGLEIGWWTLPLPAFVMVPPSVAYASSELVITNMRVLIKTGVIRRQTLEMFISKIESIAVSQGLLGRVFDYGTVLIRGTGGFQEPFEAIARPVEFRNCVQRLQSGHHRPSATTAAP